MTCQGPNTSLMGWWRGISDVGHGTLIHRSKIRFGDQSIMHMNQLVTCAKSRPVTCACLAGHQLGWRAKLATSRKMVTCCTCHITNFGDVAKLQGHQLKWRGKLARSPKLVTWQVQHVTIFGDVAIRTHHQFCDLSLLTRSKWLSMRLCFGR